MSYIVDEEGFFIDYVDKKKKKNLPSIYPKTKVGKWLTKRTIMYEWKKRIKKLDKRINKLEDRIANLEKKMIKESEEK